MIRLKIYGLATNFQVDPLSKFIIIQAKNIECERSHSSAYTINSFDDWHFCYFIENNGEVNHKLVLPEFVHYKDDIPWDTFLPSSIEQAMESRRQLVEGLFDIVFDDKKIA